MESVERREEFSIDDLIDNYLLGGSEGGLRRNKIGKMLGIGHSNGKQFLSRLNNYGITREEFNNAINSISK